MSSVINPVGPEEPGVYWRRRLLVGLGVLVAAWRQIRRKVFDPIAKTQKLVEYHLGPNGKTTPIHVRLIALEHAHNIEHHTEADQ